MAQQGLHFGLYFLLGLPPPPVAHGFVFARIGLHLCAIDGDVPQLHPSGLLAQWQGLHKQSSQPGQMLFPEICDGVVIRMLVRRQRAERHILMALPLHGSRTRHAHAITVQQQARHQQRMVALLPLAIPPIVGRIDGRQIQPFRYVSDEPRQVPFGKPLLQ